MVEALREALITIKTSFENKGPYKLQISKRDLVITTIKIKMKDDVTHVVSLSEGEFIVKILKSDKECLNATMILPNFENGSLIKIFANDSSIDINMKEVIRYKTVDEFMESMKDDDKKSKKTKKITNNVTNISKPAMNVFNNGKNISTSNKNQIQISNKNEKNENIQDMTNVSKVAEKNVLNTNNDKKGLLEEKHLEAYISRDEFQRTILELTNKYDNQIKELIQKIENLQNRIEPSTDINIKLDDI